MGKRISEFTLQELEELEIGLLDPDGNEIPNPRPLFDSVPVVQMSLEERIKRILHRELARVQVDRGMETFEEANDFDVEGDDGFPKSPYEMVEMIDEIPPGTPVKVNNAPAKGDEESPSAGETPDEARPAQSST